MQPIVIENKLFKPFRQFGPDALVLRGQKTFWVSNCIFTNAGGPPTQADELCDVSGGAKVKFLNCIFEYNGMGILAGNSSDDVDMENSLGLGLDFTNCLFRGLSRRMPYQHAGTLSMQNCIIENWGLPQTFHEKAFGIRIGEHAKASLNNVIFKQPSMWNFNPFADIKTPWHLGPGFRRGAYSESGTRIKANNCYRNQWWIHVENCNSWMSNNDAKNLENYIRSNLPNINSLDESPITF